MEDFGVAVSFLLGVAVGVVFFFFMLGNGQATFHSNHKIEPQVEITIKNGVADTVYHYPLNNK